MSSKMILLFGVPMFVGSGAILWMFWERLKKPPKKKIFISADCWLCVFDLLAPSQLGLGIALISHRFDFYVDEHFKLRHWALKFLEIRRKFGTKELIIVNYTWKMLPIPQKSLPKNVVEFKAISIEYIDNKAITFLCRFCQLFAACPINLSIYMHNDRITEFFLRNIWPILGKNIHGIELSGKFFRRLRQFVPSLFNDLPLLRDVTFYVANFFTEFPADDSAAASDGQAVAKWLFTAHSENVLKVFKCALVIDDDFLAARIEDFKAAFVSTSSPSNFIVVVWFYRSPFADFIVPFSLINELTREQLALKRTFYSDCFVLIRCPIVRNASKWAKWEEKAIEWQIYDQRNQISIAINREDNIGDGLLNAYDLPK